MPTLDDVRRLALALPEDAPAGVVLGAYVADLGAKEALLSAEPDVLLTTPHFDGHASVLVRLDEVSPELLEELVVEAWLAQAPTRLVRAYDEGREADAPRPS